MRYQPMKKTIRHILAAEGYLELQMPDRAIQALDNIDDAGELSPYLSFLRGQAYRGLERIGEAIDALQQAASTMPAPFDRPIWSDLSDCYRQQGLQELADVAEMFADEPEAGSDADFSDLDFQEFLSEAEANLTIGLENDDPWDRSGISPSDDFNDFNFDEDWQDDEAEVEADSASHRQPPLK